MWPIRQKGFDLPTCFFATDLHGKTDRYDKLLASIVRHRPAAVFLGGDLLPRSALSANQFGHEDFLQDYLVPAFTRIRDVLGEHYPDIFLILGNDDPRCEEGAFIAAAADGLWHYIHGQKLLLGEFPVYGLAYVPPTPFLLKDWERYDVSRYVPPGGVSPEEGTRTVPAEESEIKWATIQKDLASLVGEDPLDRAVLLLHTPPCETPLDRAELDGKSCEHVPLDVHVGSIAVKRFIEQRQPLLICTAKQMALVRTLIDRDQDHFEPALSRGLRDLYDGDLRFPSAPAERPFVIANFVSTLDGVVSYQINGQAGGSTISGSDPADRFIMGLLRASADAVIVGARTVQEVSPKDLWIPEYTYPDAKHLYNDYRANILHKPEYPLLVVVSASGRLDLQRAIFRTPGACTIVITTEAGRDALVKAGATKLSSVQIHAQEATGGSIDPLAILRLLYTQLGVRRLLHEGGPTLFGQFLAAEAIDELFLTLSGQIAGRRADTIRPGLVQGTEFMPDCAPWFQLLSVKQSAAHLYLRYQCTGRHKRSA